MKWTQPSFQLQKQKIFKKPAIALAVFPIVLGACSPNAGFNKTNNLAFAVSSIGSFNYATEQPQNDVLQLLVEPLIRQAAPRTLNNFLDLNKLQVKSYSPQDSKDNNDLLQHAIDFDPAKLKIVNGLPDPTTDPGKDSYGNEGTGSDFGSFNAGAADVVVVLKNELASNRSATDTTSTEDNRIIRFHIRDDLKWSNGARCDAADYVATIKHILDPKVGSSNFLSTINTLKVRNANACYTERVNYLKTNPSATADETWTNAKACQSYVNQTNSATQRIPNSGLGVRDIGNNWVEYEFDSGNTQIFDLLGSYLFFPMPEKFINQLPRKILDYGLSSQNFLSNGAFTITNLSPEYEITATKNFDYWDADQVFADSLLVKLVVNPFSYVNLYRDGVIGEISLIPPQFLAIINNDPNIKATVFRGASAATINFLKFSPAYLAKDPKTAAMNDTDFRRALYYGLNRTYILKMQNYFGLFPSGASVPTRSISLAGNRSYYQFLEKENFRPDLPGAKSEPLVKYDYNERITNNFGAFLGEDPTDYDYNSSYAKAFFQRWVNKFPNSERTLTFEYPPSLEGLAIGLKTWYEKEFSQFNFKLNLVPVLQLTLTAKQLIGDFPVTIDSYNAVTNGTSIFNWYFPYTTTSFSFDRRYAQQTKYFGDTLPSYARRLALTVDGRKRLQEMGLDPNPYATSKDAVMWSLLQTLDNYSTKKDLKNASLPTYSPTLRRADNLNWKTPYPLMPSDPNEEYIFRMGQGVGNNNTSIKFGDGFIVENNLFANNSNNYGIYSNFDLFGFYTRLERLMRDSAFTIPINNYAAQFYASRLVGFGFSNNVGFGRNLVHAYRYDVPVYNKNKIRLPGQEIINASQTRN